MRQGVLPVREATQPAGTTQIVDPVTGDPYLLRGSC